MCGCVCERRSGANRFKEALQLVFPPRGCQAVFKASLDIFNLCASYKTWFCVCSSCWLRSKLHTWLLIGHNHCLHYSIAQKREELFSDFNARFSDFSDIQSKFWLWQSCLALPKKFFITRPWIEFPVVFMPVYSLVLLLGLSFWLPCVFPYSFVL